MKFTPTVFLASLFLLSPARPTRRAPGCAIGTVTPAQILQFAPGAASCAAGGQFASECRTAQQAAPFVNAAFTQFGIRTPGEKAALLSLMSFETGDFKFDRNHFPAPGRPGQGTRNLMMFNNVMRYAQNTTSTAAQANALAPDPANATDDQKNAVLALMLPDGLSFASAAWFYKTTPECASTEQGLQAASEAGWETYITQCVSTEVTEPRRTAYLAALAALS